MKATLAAAPPPPPPPPPYGDDGSRPGRACHNVSVCIRNCFLAVNNFCSTLHFIPKVHRIETEAAPRDHDNFKLPCAWCLLFTVHVFCFSKNLDVIMVISFQPHWKIGHILCKMHYLVAALMWSKYMTWTWVFLQHLEVRERNCGKNSFWILGNGGITHQKRKLNIIPSRVHMSMQP